MSLAAHFHAFLDDRKDPAADVQICLTGGGPMAGKITLIAGDGADRADDRVYKIECLAQIGPRAQPVTMAFVFAGSSLVWYSTGPEQAPDRPRIDLAGSWPST